MELDEAQAMDFVFATFCAVFFIAAFGTVANVVNLIIFFKHGFKDTVNISLFALALSDICSLLPLVWTGVLADSRFLPFDVDFRGMDVLFLAGSWPHTCFARLTGWITAYIMFERCLCIASPLKVKIWLVPARVKCIHLVIHALIIIGVVPTYFTNSLGWSYDPVYNRTLLRLQQTDNALEVANATSVLNSFVSTLCAFGLTAVCTVVIIIKLNQKTKRREGMTFAGTGKANHRKVSNIISQKDRKAIKMVATVSTVFLITATPSVSLVIITVVNNEFTIFGRLRNVFYMTYSFNFLLEAVNSSFNIFIYYTMNRRYRNTFKNIFF